MPGRAVSCHAGGDRAARTQCLRCKFDCTSWQQLTVPVSKLTSLSWPACSAAAGGGQLSPATHSSPRGSCGRAMGWRAASRAAVSWAAAARVSCRHGRACVLNTWVLPELRANACGASRAQLMINPT